MNNYNYNKKETGFFNHKNQELLLGDIVDQGGSKNYVVLEDSRGYEIVNFGYASIPLDFFVTEDFSDREFNIKGNIFDNPELIVNSF